MSKMGNNSDSHTLLVGVQSGHESFVKIVSHQDKYRPAL